MKKYFLIMSGLLIIFVTFTSITRAEGLKEGKWSMTMVTKMDNMPPQMAAAMQQMQNLPPQAQAMMKQMEEKNGIQMSGDGQGMTITSTHCVTNKNPVPNYMKKTPDDCQQTHEINGNTVKFHVTCDRNDMKIDSSGMMTYTGDTMQGHIKSHEERAGKSMDSTMDITGQYLGPCS